MTVRLQKFITGTQQGFLEAVLNNKKKLPVTKTTSFAISSRGQKIWNNYLHEFEKKVSLALFLRKLKIKLLESEDELAFF